MSAVSKLSERAEELLRQFLSDRIRPAEMQGYDPQQTDTTADDFLPVTNDWSDFGDTYPILVVQETDGPSVPGGGNTNVTGLQGDGSGVNQYTIFNLTISAQAVQGDDYLNDTEADDLAHDIFSEARKQCQLNTTALDETLWLGPPPPGTQTRSTEETDSGSTETWVQRQATVPVGVQFEP
jgi:hypothetical protein